MVDARVQLLKVCPKEPGAFFEKLDSGAFSKSLEESSLKAKAFSFDAKQ